MARFSCVHTYREHRNVNLGLMISWSLIASKSISLLFTYIHSLNVIRAADRNISSALSGPEPSAVELDDCQFHQCVKLGKFDNDRTISFIPPDGEFELMRYRSTTNVNLPFKVTPIVEEHGKTRVEYTIHVRTTFSPKLNATNVILKIPTPLNSATVEPKVTLGKARYNPADNTIVWKIPRIQGQADVTFTASVTRTTTTHQKAWSRPPISIDFQVLMFTASGLLVRFLKVFEKSGYNSVKWVRYLTKANGTYQIRVSQFASTVYVREG